MRYANDHNVFLFDRDHNAYQIVDAEIADYYPFEEVDALEKKEGISSAHSDIKSLGKDINRYTIKRGSIWKKEANAEEVCLIRRPICLCL